MAPSILRRDDIARLSSGAWIGIGIAAAVVSVACIYLIIRLVQSDMKRHDQWRKSPTSPTFASKQHQPQSQHSRDESVLTVLGTTTFSRARLTASVILPAKALTRTSAPPSDEQIMAYHRATKTIPRRFSPLHTPPFSQYHFTTDLSPVSDSKSELLPPPPIRDDDRYTSPIDSKSKSKSIKSTRYSTASSKATRRPISASSLLSTNSSINATNYSFTIQKGVRQTFTPLLADELPVALGETMTIVQSYTDGWCVVGREGYSGEMEMGAVPAWCFSKKIPGLAVERPRRVQSIGVSFAVEQRDWERESEKEKEIVRRKHDSHVSWSNL